MKYIRVKIIFILFLFITGSGFSQKKQKLPDIDLRDLNSKIVNTSSFNNQAKPIILTFWATWCKPCIRELSAYNENYEEWKKNTGVKIIAVSIDDIRSKNKVAPYVRGRDWDFEVYLDSNEDLKRAMNINTVPHTFLINGSGEIVWQHNSFAEGDEEKLYERILAISKK